MFMTTSSHVLCVGGEMRTGEAGGENHYLFLSHEYVFIRHLKMLKSMLFLYLTDYGLNGLLKKQSSVFLHGVCSPKTL